MEKVFMSSRNVCLVLEGDGITIASDCSLQRCLVSTDKSGISASAVLYGLTDSSRDGKKLRDDDIAIGGVWRTV